MRLRKRRDLESRQWDDLATYNGEVARGIMHTPEYDEKMASAQVAFTRWQKQRLFDDGFQIIGENDPERRA